MATKEDIDLLLKGREIIDKYVSAKTDRSDPRWEHPSIEELNKAIEGLGFKTTDDFYLFDAKLSFLEIADAIDLINQRDKNKPPLCDACVGREPQLCLDIMVATGMSITCHQERATKDVEVYDYLTPNIKQVVAVDPVLELQKKQTKEYGRAIGDLCTLNEIVVFWNYLTQDTKCVAKIVQKREFDFDPFWRLGSMCLPLNKE